MGGREGFLLRLLERGGFFVCSPNGKHKKGYRQHSKPNTRGERGQEGTNEILAEKK